MVNSNQINFNEQKSETNVEVPHGEDWDLALQDIKEFSKNEFGSDDECDHRDLTLEMDAFGLNQEDIR